MIRWVGATGETLGERDGLEIYRPAAPGIAASDSAQRFRIEVYAPRTRPSIHVSLVTRPGPGKRSRHNISSVPLERLANGRLSTPWFVLVSEPDDLAIPGLSGRSLLATLSDDVEVRVRRGGGRAAVHSRAVGSSNPDDEDSVNLLMRAGVSVLRLYPDGPPVVGGDRGGAEEIARYQVELANRVLAQCHITLGDPREIPVTVDDPPGPWVISVGYRYGLLSAGGQIRLVVNGKPLGPWKVGQGYTPEETARLIAGQLRKEGFTVDLLAASPDQTRANPSAQLVVRNSDGGLATIASWVAEPVSNDRSQSMTIASVHLDDGLDAYDANTIGGGTLEERVLLGVSAPSGSRRTKIFFVNRFATPQKQGESFLVSGGAESGGAAILDRRALLRARQSYTLAHELGHILLQDLGHPDTDGDDRAWLLMNSRASSALQGPRLITDEHCRRMRRYEGLVPYDGVVKSSGE